MRMPPGAPGRIGADGRPPPSRPPGPAPSRRIGLPTSSRPPPERGWPGRDGPGRPAPGSPALAGVGRWGAPGRAGVAGRWFWLPAATGRGLTPGRCAGGRMGGFPWALPGGLDPRAGWGRPTNSGLATGRWGGAVVRFTGAGAAGRPALGAPLWFWTGLGEGTAGRGLGVAGRVFETGLLAGALGRAGGALTAGFTT